MRSPFSCRMLHQEEEDMEGVKGRRDGKSERESRAAVIGIRIVPHLGSYTFTKTSTVSWLFFIYLHNREIAEMTQPRICADSKIQHIQITAS